MKRTLAKIGRKVSSFVLVAGMVLSTPGLTMYAQAAAEFTTPEGLYQIYSTEYKIAPGIVESHYVTNDASLDNQVMGYAVTVDLANNSTVSMGAGYANNDGTTWSMQSTTDQAKAAEKANGYNVVAAVNADFFNMATGAPRGALVMNGIVYHKTSSHPYFAILNDGKAAIREGNVSLSDVKEAVGGSTILVKNGVINSELANSAYESGKEPRTAVGIKADGSVVLYVADGRQYPKSNGLSFRSLAEMMVALGCVDALNLDGGGSTTFATEREGSSELVVQNSPSDGMERTVSSSLFVYSTAKSDGVFNHATLTPNNDAYTPYSQVQFNASGVDSVGGPAELPAGTYALADDSADKGSITADGLFTSTGAVGTVNVNYLVDGKVVGTTSIVISKPDTVSFTNDEVSLGFSTPSDLGLTVFANGRAINYNDNDFNWILSDEKMGSFNGNIFTSSEDATVTGTITCEYKYNTEVKSSITAIIGKLPTVVWDFENPEEYEGLYTSNYNRGGVQSAEIVNLDSGEPVRFGNNSLKLNYDFTKCGSVTEGACIGMTEKYEVPGVPTGIGVWVYAPEGTAPTAKQQKKGYSGFWLRGYFTDGSGRLQAFDYTLEPKQCTNGQKAGIYWEGWQYCEADLTKYAGPYSLQPGMTFRLMYVAGTKMGTKTAGSIYFDNLQFVYGANIDDTDTPVIDTITANDQEIKDGDVITTNTVSFTSTFHDIQNKYTTGIDYDTVRMYIDGVNVVENDMYVLDKGANKAFYYDVPLANGTHSIKVLVRDGFGNEITETRFFEVNAADNEATTMTIEPATGKVPVLGQTFPLEIKASDASEITSVSTSLKIDENFTVNSVLFAEGFEGTYSVKNKILTINASGKAESASNTVATIYFNVPASLNSAIAFTYYTTKGEFTTVSNTGKTNSFSVAQQKLAVNAPYTVTADTLVEGQAGNVYVTDIYGTKIEGAKVYLVNGSSKTEVGTTDENGLLVTDAVTAAAGKITLSAEFNGGVSFTTDFNVLTAVADANPYNIISNASVNGNTTKSISWMSNVLNDNKKAVAQVATAADYAANGEAALVEYAGSYKENVYVGDYKTVRNNSVIIENLTPGTKYVYRVGDGQNWSEIAEFTTDAVDDSVNFFIIGDIQASDLENNEKVISNILNGTQYAFGLQTGDAVDDAIKYNMWNELISSYDNNGLQNIDMIHVLGNHEYAGDENAQLSQDIYNLPDGGCYSVEYDNVYIAVINYAKGDNAELAATTQWLIEDAAKSDAKWKVLAIHQPPYYTNIGGGNNYINMYLPDACEEAGIDFVFSGHDHAYARTAQLKDGEVVEAGGTVYYVCGSTGEKSYTATNTPEFHFEALNDSFDAVYLTANVTDTTFTVTARDLNGNIIDAYTMQDQCSINGHEYVFDGTDLICEKCHKKVNAVNAAYTGFVKDKETGRKMYLVVGVPYVGILNYADSQYYFDENGLGIDGKYVEGLMTYDLEDGLIVNRNGVYVFAVKNRKTVYKGYVNNENAFGWCELNGGWYYFNPESGLLNTSSAITISGVKYLFDKEHHVIGGTWYTNSKGKRYYVRSEYLTGWQEVDGNKYYFNPSTGYVAVGICQIGAKFYEFDETGILVKEFTEGYTGFIKKDAKTTYYYVNDERVYGWQKIDGNTYYFDTTSGVMRYNRYKVGGVTYDFSSDGILTKGAWLVKSTGTRYYFAGEYYVGWQVIDGNRYYFDKDGYMQTGVVNINGAFWTFDDNGICLSESGDSTYTGFVNDSSYVLYYENGTPVTGWKCIDGYYYYFDTNCHMNLKKARTVSGVRYEFDSQGRLTTGTWKGTSKGSRYYYAGEYAVGYTVIDGKPMYFTEVGGYLVTNKTVVVNGTEYYADENGVLH